MVSKIKQRLIPWTPTEEVAGKTPSFGDIEIVSADSETLAVTLPYEEGKLCVHFSSVRAFMTTWDGDPNPFLTFKEVGQRPRGIVKVDGSRWLASAHFYLDVESAGQASTKPWEHFYILSSERSIHIAARDDVKTTWMPGTWSGKPGSWTFLPGE